MEIEHGKKHSYLDEYKILKTLGAGYHAQYFSFYSESNLVKTNKAGWWLSKSIKKKLPLSKLLSMNSTS